MSIKGASPWTGQKEMALPGSCARQTIYRSIASPSRLQELLRCKEQQVKYLLDRDLTIVACNGAEMHTAVLAVVPATN